MTHNSNISESSTQKETYTCVVFLFGPMALYLYLDEYYLGGGSTILDSTILHIS